MVVLELGFLRKATTSREPKNQYSQLIWSNFCSSLEAFWIGRTVRYYRERKIRLCFPHANVSLYNPRRTGELPFNHFTALTFGRAENVNGFFLSQFVLLENVQLFVHILVD